MRDTGYSSTSLRMLFMTRVKDAAEKCQYGAETYDIMVRDIFVSRLVEQYRKVLPTQNEDQLTIELALEKALIEEQALKGNESMNYINPGSIHAVRSSENQKSNNQYGRGKQKDPC